jgi:predicted Zn-dependent peptidase
MIVAAAGNVEHASVLGQVRHAFADYLGEAPGAPAPRRAAVSRAPARPLAVFSDDTEQANVVLGMRGLSRYDERRFALGVLSAALGGGMSSRLFQSIREQRGLAYSVYSFTGSYSDTGTFGVYAGCQPAKAHEVLDLITDTLTAVAGGELTSAEIERGKGQMRGSLVLGLEDAGSRMTRIGKSELVYGDVLGVDDLLDRVDRVTRRDVAEVAEQVLGEPRCLTVVGPFEPADFAGIG